MEDGFSRKPSVTFTEEEIAFKRRIINDELTEEEQKRLDEDIKKYCTIENKPREVWMKEAVKAKHLIDIR